MSMVLFISAMENSLLGFSFFYPTIKQCPSESLASQQPKSHCHAAEHRRGCRKRSLHCLSAASLQTLGSIEEHRASRLRRDKWLGAFSLVRFFGQAKK
jgi:hypothetical protein